APRRARGSPPDSRQPRHCRQARNRIRRPARAAAPGMGQRVATVTATTAAAARTDARSCRRTYPAAMKQPRNPATIHAPLGRYVHQIEVSGESRMLFLAGQVGIASDGSVPADPVAQLGVALDNVMANLEAAGFVATDLVKLTTYVVGEMDA